MSCNVDYALRLAYPNTVDVMFLSASGDPIANSIDGAIAELQKLCSTTVKPLERKLRAISGLDAVMQSEKCFLEKIEFFIYDSTSIGASGQDDETTAAIYASRATNDVLAQSSYLNAMQPINFQPNFFRPKLLINGTNYLRGMNNTGSDAALADIAIGLPLPYCFERNCEVGKLTNIEITAAYAQKVNTKFLNYPILALATFWIK